jgi:hypothetical protein
MGAKAEAEPTRATIQAAENFMVNIDRDVSIVTMATNKQQQQQRAVMEFQDGLHRRQTHVEVANGEDIFPGVFILRNLKHRDQEPSQSWVVNGYSLI